MASLACSTFHMHVVRALDVAHPANPGTKANIISWFSSSISTISLLSPWSFHLLPSPCSCLCWGHYPYPCRGSGCRSLLSPLVSFHSSWQQLWSVHGGILSFLPAHSYLHRDAWGNRRFTRLHHSQALEDHSFSDLLGRNFWKCTLIPMEIHGQASVMLNPCFHFIRVIKAELSAHPGRFKLAFLHRHPGFDVASVWPDNGILGPFGQCWHTQICFILVWQARHFDWSFSWS